MFISTKAIFAKIESQNLRQHSSYYISLVNDKSILLFHLVGGDSDSYGLGVKSAFRGFKFLRLVKLLSLLKLLRLSRIMRYVSKYEDVSN